MQQNDNIHPLNPDEAINKGSFLKWEYIIAGGSQIVHIYQFKPSRIGPHHMVSITNRSSGQLINTRSYKVGGRAAFKKYVEKLLGKVRS